MKKWNAPVKRIKQLTVSAHTPPIVRAMPPKKADLVEELLALGEVAPTRWTIPEIKVRIAEIKEERGLPMGHRKTELQQWDHSTQQSGQQESGLATLPDPRAPGASESQLDNPTAPAPRHGEDLRPQSRGWKRSCRLWSPQCQELRGSDVARGRVCELGDRNHEGGRLFHPTSSSWEVVGGSTKQQERQGQEQGLQDNSNKDIQGTTTTSGEQLSRAGRVDHGAAGDDATDDGDQGRVGRGSWTPTQEDSEGRGHGVQHPVELGDTSLSTSHGTTLSADEHMKPLSTEAIQFIRGPQNDVAAVAFENVVHSDKQVLLMEVACSPDSRLAHFAQQSAGRENAALRCSHWNGCDLGTGAGVHMIISQINRHRPKHVYISPECGPYSPIQNLNQKTPQQKQELEEKRRAVLKQYVGARCVYEHCIQQGIHVTWEWSEKCQGWRLPLIQTLQNKYQLYGAVVHGCQVNLRRKRTQQLMRKGWKLMTTHKRVAEIMHLPCRCPKQYQHGICEGDMTRKSAYYTDEYAKRFIRAIQVEMVQSELVEEFQGTSRLPPLFGGGAACYCKDVHNHGVKLTCGSCHVETIDQQASGLPHEAYMHARGRIKHEQDTKGNPVGSTTNQGSDERERERENQEAAVLAACCYWTQQHAQHGVGLAEERG